MSTKTCCPKFRFGWRGGGSYYPVVPLDAVLTEALVIVQLDELLVL